MEAQDVFPIFAQMTLQLAALKKEFQPQLALTVLQTLQEIGADRKLKYAHPTAFQQAQLEINALVSDWLMQLRATTARRKVYKPLLQAFLQVHPAWTREFEKAWLDQLWHSDPLQQKLALRIITTFSSPSCLKLLYDWLEDPDFALRREIRTLLGQTSFRDFQWRLQKMLEKLSSLDPELQAWARDWILRTRLRSSQLYVTAELWLDLWKSTPDSALKLKAACMLAERGLKMSLSFLLAQLLVADRSQATAIRFALRPHQDPAIQKIWSDLLTHPVPHLRVNAAKGLRTFAKEPAVQAALMQAWQDPLPEVQLAAAISLARVPETGPQLALWVRQQLDTEQVQPQLMALKVLHKGAVLALGSSLSLLLARVMPLLEADQLRLARKAAFVLGELGFLPAVAALQAIVANPAAPRALQVTAREALAKIIGPSVEP